MISFLLQWSLCVGVLRPYRFFWSFPFGAKERNGDGVYVRIVMARRERDDQTRNTFYVHIFFLFDTFISIKSIIANALPLHVNQTNRSHNSIPLLQHRPRHLHARHPAAYLFIPLLHIAVSHVSSRLDQQ